MHLIKPLCYLLTFCQSYTQIFNASQWFRLMFRDLISLYIINVYIYIIYITIYYKCWAFLQKITTKQHKTDTQSVYVHYYQYAPSSFQRNNSSWSNFLSQYTEVVLPLPLPPLVCLFSPAPPPSYPLEIFPRSTANLEQMFLPSPPLVCLLS